MTIERAGRLPAGIFRTYDIRGIVGDTLTPEIVRWIGRAIGAEAHHRGVRTLVVGRDGRHSSREMGAALVSGLRESGRDVVDVGRAPTPVLYFAAEHLDTGTRRHGHRQPQPTRVHGLKIVLAGQSLHSEAIQDLRRRMEEDESRRRAGRPRAGRSAEPRGHRGLPSANPRRNSGRVWSRGQEDRHRLRQRRCGRRRTETVQGARARSRRSLLRRRR